jgi:site-specific DNA recombinase
VTVDAFALPGIVTPARRGNRVFDYRRVSKAREEMISPKMQGDANIAAVAREALTIVGPTPDGLIVPGGEPIEDLDETGRDFARRKIMWMIEQVRAGFADGVVVWQVSRWGRNLEESLRHVRLLHEAGGYLVSATEGVGQVDTPFGRFALAQMLLIAQLQSDQIAAGWRQVLDRRRRFGLPQTNDPRFAYVYDPKAEAFRDFGSDTDRQPLGIHVPNRELAPWIERAYVNYVDGKGLTGEVTAMHEAGIVNAQGSQIIYTYLLHYLDSAFAAGLIVKDARRGKRNAKPASFTPGAHEPIVSLDLFSLYQAKRKEKTTPPSQKNPKGPFSGLVACGTCGKNMIRSQDDGVPNIVCGANKYNSYKPCFAKATMREHLLIKAIIAWLRDEQEKAREVSSVAPHWHDEEARAKDRETIIANLKDEEGRITRRIDRYLQRRDEAEDRGDSDTAADYKRNTEQAQAERKAIRLRLAEVRTQSRRAEAPPTPDELEVLVRILTDPRVPVDTTNVAMRKLLHKVYVYPRAAEFPRVRPVGRWEPEAIEASVISASAASIA